MFEEIEENDSFESVWFVKLIFVLVNGERRIWKRVQLFKIMEVGRVLIRD